MKSTLLFCTLLTSASALFISSNNYAEVSNPLENLQTEAMQNMMGNMQKIQTCMEGVDQTELMALGQQAKTVQESIEKECAAGNVKGAEKTAINFVNTLKTSKAAAQTQNCLKDLPEMMKGHISGTDFSQLQSEFEKKGICAIKNP